MLKSFVFVIFSVQIILAQHHFAPIPVNPFNNNVGWQRNPYAPYFPQPIFPTNGPYFVPFNPNPHGMPLPPNFPPPILPNRIPNFPLPINPTQNPYTGGPYFAAPPPNFPTQNPYTAGPYFPAPPPNFPPPQANPQQPWNNQPMWPATTPTSVAQNEYNPGTNFNRDTDLPINSNANGDLPNGGNAPYFPAPLPNFPPPQANSQQPWNGQGTANQPNRNFLNPNNNEPMWPATTPTSAVQNEYNPRTDFNGDKDLPINSNANGGTNINAIIPSGSDSGFDPTNTGNNLPKNIQPSSNGNGRDFNVSDWILQYPNTVSTTAIPNSSAAENSNNRNNSPSNGDFNDVSNGLTDHNSPNLIRNNDAAGSNDANNNINNDIELIATNLPTTTVSNQSVRHVVDLRNEDTL